jgi:hypothetical protein
MENLFIIIAIVSCAAAVLQFILIFKIWGMCNDIKAIRKHLTTNTKQDELPSSSDKEDNTALIIILSTLFAIIFLCIIFGCDF